MDSSKEAKKYSELFIAGIKKGIYRKRTLPNSAKPYPIEKARKSATSFLNSELFEQMLKEED